MGGLSRSGNSAYYQTSATATPIPEVTATVEGRRVMRLGRSWCISVGIKHSRNETKDDSRRSAQDEKHSSRDPIGRRIYWKPGSRFYGKTKQGEFMPESEALESTMQVKTAGVTNIFPPGGRIKAVPENGTSSLCSSRTLSTVNLQLADPGASVGVRNKGKPK